MCEYVDDLTQLCPQQSSSNLVEEFSHGVGWQKLISLLLIAAKPDRWPRSKDDGLLIEAIDSCVITYLHHS